MRRKAMLRGTQGSTAKTAHTAISLLFRGGDSDSRNWLSRTLLRRGMRSSIPWSVLEGQRSRNIAGRFVGLAIDPPWRREGALRKAAASGAAEVIRSGALVSGGLHHERLAAIAETTWERTVRECFEQLRSTGFTKESLETWKTLGQSQTLIAPYMLAATSLARQRIHARRLHDELSDQKLVAPWPAPPEPHVAMFTDTIDEINGVAAVLQPLVAFAEAQEWPFTMVSCGKRAAQRPDPRDLRGTRSLQLRCLCGVPPLHPAGTPAPALVRKHRDRRDPRRHARAHGHGRRPSGAHPGTAAGRLLPYRPAAAGVLSDVRPHRARGPLDVCARLLQPGRDRLLPVACSAGRPHPAWHPGPLRELRPGHRRCALHARTPQRRRAPRAGRR